jgi:hypothetical protein
MKEFMIGGIIGLILIALGVQLAYRAGNPVGYVVGIAGALVIYAAHRLSGRIFKQLVPRYVVEQLVSLSQSQELPEDVATLGPHVAIVPLSMAGSAELKLEDVYELGKKVFSAKGSPAIGLAVSKKHEVVFANLKALRKAFEKQSARMIVNDWGSLTGAIGMAGYRWIEIDDWRSGDFDFTK